MKPPYIKTGIVLLLALLAGVAVYYFEREVILADTAATFDSRAHLIEKYMAMMGHNVEVMETLVERHENFAIATPQASRGLDSIRHFRGPDVWGVSGLASEDGLADLSGSLTGTEVVADPSPAVRRELSAMFHIDHQFGLLLENVPETLWVYYTSKNGFIHIAPGPPVAELHFSEVMYSKPFWTEAVPERNPRQRQIISELYDDYFGQGLMISISSPVEMNGEFTGVMSVDIGIDQLRELTGVGRAAGESILVDDHHQIVASDEEFEPGERYEVPSADTWSQDRLEVLWLTYEVVPGELRLIHRLPRLTLAGAAAWRSLPAWIVLAALAALVLVSMRLHKAFGQVRHAMRRDTLTDLLNRRGFESEAASVRQQAARHGQRTSLLLFDIDYFKQVNDEHGHNIGDEVLQSLARRLMTGVDEQDRVCRWGGEEILVLLVHDDKSSPARIAERLRRSVEETPMTAEDLYITVSGGLTEWPADEDLYVAVKRADESLYRAKDNGRNRIETDLREDEDGD
ncbi:MAG: diguanylate cyclase [Halofilum sp. (in: g-proteobacteria)]|nr:diguanylate cyclase [Halofilum sp. (in: g-proteobacteria)]